MKKVTVVILILLLFISLHGFKVNASSTPEPDLILDEEFNIPQDRVKPEITKGIPMVSNYVVIDGVKIPKYYAELPIVKEEGKIRLILTLQEPPLANKGNATKIKLQQDSVVKYLETKKSNLKLLLKLKIFTTKLQLKYQLKNIITLEKFLM